MIGSRRRAVLLTASAFLLAIASSICTAVAQEAGGRVVVLEPAASSAEVRRCLTRVSEELAAGGFAVDVADPGPGSDPISLAGAMRDQTGATAVIALIGEPTSGVAELWVLDRIGGQAEVHRIAAPIDDPEHVPEVLAIRTIEALRASALRMLVESSRSTPATKPSRLLVSATASDQDQGPSKSRFGVETGVSVLESIDGPGPAALPLIRLRASLGRRFFVRAGVAGFGSRPVVTTRIGSATVSQAFGLLEVGLAFRPAARLQPLVTLGGGGLYIEEVGRGVTPFLGSEASHWSALADAGAGVSAALGSRLMLAVEAHVFVSFPYPTIRFEDATAATVGRPALLGSLALVAWL